MQVSDFTAILKADFGRFRPVSACFRPVSACFGRFPACFGRIGSIGRRPIRPDMADTARFWPNQPDSARIEADSARIEPHRRESSQVGANPRKKKKKPRRGPTRGQPRRTPHPASRRVERGCGTSGTASVHSSLPLSITPATTKTAFLFLAFKHLFSMSSPVIDTVQARL